MSAPVSILPIDLFSYTNVDVEMFNVYLNNLIILNHVCKK